MKSRYCDRCNKVITIEYVKCSKSEYVNKQQHLTYLGDLCIDCWNTFKRVEVKV